MSQAFLSNACRAAKGRANSPAAFFVQLFRRSLATTSPQLQSSVKPVHARKVSSSLLLPYPMRRGGCHRLIPSASSPTPTSLGAPSALSVFSTQRSAFSTTTSHHATKVILNPRTNDDGQALEVRITPRAAKHLHKITAPKQPPEDPSQEPPTYEYLRVTVQSGGCHGFQYEMSLDKPENINPEEDTVFQYEPEEGEDYPRDIYGGARVVMDLPSLEVLYGSSVDFTQELIGSQFVIADNPRATSSCGCGTSFDIA